MVDESHAAHLAAHRLKRPRAEVVSLAQRAERGQKQSLGIFHLYKNRQEYLLVAPIPWKKKLGQFIQSANPRNFVAVKFYLCTRRSFHPWVFVQN